MTLALRDTRLVDAAVTRHIHRVRRGEALAADGRHAAGERVLRDAACALVRRRAFEPAVGAMIALGCLLLERGRPADAAREFDAAARCAADAGDPSAAAIARLWRAHALIDENRLADAERVCLTELGGDALPRSHLPWARMVLARALVWQGDLAEAGRIDLAAPDGEHGLGPRTVAEIHATAVTVLLARGQLFEAGLRARRALTELDGCDALCRLAAGAAHLLVLAAAGDLVAAGEAFTRAAVMARVAHAPLRLAWARLTWHEALHRAGRVRDAEQELARLARVRRAAPPLLRRAIDNRLAAPAVHDAAPRLHAPFDAVALVRLAQAEGDDLAVLRAVAETTARELGASRLEVVSLAAGQERALLAIGAGPATHASRRVLHEGERVTPQTGTGPAEAGIVVRLGGGARVAVVARWPDGTRVPANAVAALDLAGACAAPRLEALSAAGMTARPGAVPQLVGVSRALDELRLAIERAARAPFSVLIEGESGVGKELVARAIHELGPRHARRFADVNCAALSEDLLDAELFGHARGAFTGAVADRAGLFEEASGGTLFLDEVADLSPRAQAKLLRVIQQQEVRRVGETRPRPIDVRLVAAANRDMRVEASEGRFRQDLLYRLDVIRVRVTPLRDRPEDVPVLALHFWRAAAARVGSSATLTKPVLAALTRYPWPGNVRELQNVIAAIAVAAPVRGPVGPASLPSSIAASPANGSRLSDVRTEAERRCVERALARTSGSRTRAARELGLSRQGLLKTMARLGIGGSSE